MLTDQDHGLEITGLVEVEMQSGHRLLLDRNVPEQAEAIQRREYEGSTVRLCAQLMPRKGVFFDIGANIGVYTCEVGHLLGKRLGHIYAFEPVTQNYNRVHENVSLNNLGRFVSLFRVALGDSSGVLTMHIHPAGSANNAIGDNMLSAEDRKNIAAENWKTDHAALIRIDDLFPASVLKRCDVIKVDVEGADLLALRGARALINRCRPVIVAEFNPYWIEQLGLPFEHVKAFAHELDYLILREKDNVLYPLSDALIGSGLDIPSYVLTPREKLRWVNKAYLKAGGTLG